LGGKLQSRRDSQKQKIKTDPGSWGEKRALASVTWGGSNGAKDKKNGFSGVTLPTETQTGEQPWGTRGREREKTGSKHGAKEHLKPLGRGGGGSCTQRPRAFGRTGKGGFMIRERNPRKEKKNLSHKSFESPET